jgi:zinc transporter ZupT
MNLWTSVSLIAGSMAAAAAVPFFSTDLIRQSRPLFLLGTGALAGVCLFELIPDLHHEGGWLSLGLCALVALAYAGLHLRHGHGLTQDEDHATEPKLFFVSILAHCFSTGIFLVSSGHVSNEMATDFFVASISHKAFEAFIFSTLLVQRWQGVVSKYVLLALYLISIPLGAALATLFGDSMSRQLALVLSSLATGSLLGCLIFDFLIPSLKENKPAVRALVWILVGLGLTQAVLHRLIEHH